MFDEETHKRAVAYAAVDHGFISHSDLIKWYNVDQYGTLTHKSDVNNSFRTNILLRDFPVKGSGD